VNASRDSQHLDRKSLRKVTGPTTDFGELARDCVCFANGAGGTVLIGIEDSSRTMTTHHMQVSVSILRCSTASASASVS
jgi:predicted HTH transcriptional regulator